MRVVVTGGAGFLGSHLCDALLTRGDNVVCLDNLSTGRLENIQHLLEHARFKFRQCDVSAGTDVSGRVDAIAHLASPASPPEYLRMPIETLMVGSHGTEHALRLAQANNARFVLASTSEIYGDPTVHPQPEEYWGNVNSIGPRSVYDEAKRFAEALTFAHVRAHGLDAGIVRIFNTYGPRLRPSDGRVVSTFIRQALAGEPLTVFGDGSQTRSLCYVDDLVRGLVLVGASRERGPFNLGNPNELSVAALAALVLARTGCRSRIERHPLPLDDPPRRCPDIAAAQALLSWAPTVDLEEGLDRTIAWFRVSGTPSSSRS